jgi:hypothetical protein
MHHCEYSHEDTELLAQREHLSNYTQAKYSSKNRHPEDDPEDKHSIFAAWLHIMRIPRSCTQIEEVERGQKGEKDDAIADIFPIVVDPILKRRKEWIDREDHDSVYKVSFWK